MDSLSGNINTLASAGKNTNFKNNVPTSVVEPAHFSGYPVADHDYNSGLEPVSTTTSWYDSNNASSTSASDFKYYATYPWHRTYLGRDSAYAKA